VKIVNSSIHLPEYCVQSLILESQSDVMDMRKKILIKVHQWPMCLTLVGFFFSLFLNEISI
jgi:hypothetical protein